MNSKIRGLATQTMKLGSFEIDVYDAPRGVLTKEDIFDDVITVVAKSRGWTTPEQHNAIRQTYKFQPFLDADRVFVILRDNTPQGFCSVRFLESGTARIHHLSNAALVPELQSKGLLVVALTYPALIDASRATFVDNILRGHQFFTFISQSPVVYGAMSRAGAIFPMLDGSPPPADVRDIAALIARTINPHLVFDLEKFIIRRECSFFYKDIPRHHTPEVNAFFDSLLDYPAGDVIVGVLQLSKQTLKIANYFKHRARFL